MAAHLPDDLTHDEALELFTALRRKFNWSGTVQTIHDIEVTLQNNPDDPEDVDYGDASDLTDAMIAAVTGTYSWDKIPDRMAEVGNANTPVVTILSDGSFTVLEIDGDEHTYAADGTPIKKN